MIDHAVAIPPKTIPKQMLVHPTRRQLFRIPWRVGLGVEMGWDVIICGGNAEAFCDHCEFDKWGAKSAGFDIQWILFIRPKKRNWVCIQKLLISTSTKKLGYFSELRTRVFLKYSFNTQITQTQVERFTSIFPTIQTFGPWQIYLDLKYETSLKAGFLLKSKISNNEKVKVWPQSLLLRNLVLKTTTYYIIMMKSSKSALIFYICNVRIENDLHPYLGQ